MTIAGRLMRQACSTVCTLRRIVGMAEYRVTFLGVGVLLSRFCTARVHLLVAVCGLAPTCYERARLLFLNRLRMAPAPLILTVSSATVFFEGLY